MSKQNSCNTEEKLLNKCPICGSDLEYYRFYQYSKVHAIKKDGKIVEIPKRTIDDGSLDCGIISCTSCDFSTNCDLEVENYKHIIISQRNGSFYYKKTD